MARLALVVLAFGLIICVYAESEEHQKHSRYQVDNQDSRSTGHYDNHRNKGRDNKWDDQSSQHGYNKNKKGRYSYNKHQRGNSYPGYRYPGKGDYNGYEKSSGRGCGCDHNKDGYHKHKGSKGGSYYPGYNSRRPNSNGNYRKNWGEDYNRGDNGSSNYFNKYAQGHGKVDNDGFEKSKGSGYESNHNSNGYPSYKGPTGGRYAPGYYRDSTSSPNRDGNYNRGDNGSSKNNNFNEYVQGHGKVVSHVTEKPKGSGYESDHSRDGYPSYKGPTGGRYAPGYYRDSNGSPNRDGNYNRGDNGPGKNNNINEDVEGHGKVDYHVTEKPKGSRYESDHSRDCYPSYKGPTGGRYAPGYYRVSTSSPNRDGNYNRGDNGSSKNNNFNEYVQGHGKVDSHDTEKPKGSGYESDHNRDGYPSYKGPAGGRYAPGYYRDSNSSPNRDSNYNRGDNGSSKNNNINHVQDKSHGSNYDDKKYDFNNVIPVSKGGNHTYNKFDTDVKGSADERDSKERRRIDTHDADHYIIDGRRIISIKHDNGTTKDSRNKQKTENESTSDAGVANNVYYSYQHTKVSTEGVDEDTTESTNNEQKTESVRSQNDGLITKYQDINHKAGIIVRTDTDVVNNNNPGGQNISIDE